MRVPLPNISYRSYVDNIEAGAIRYSSWRKSPTQASTAGIWFDLSMMPGNPLPNYYANTPLVATLLGKDDGIPPGGTVTPATKRLKSLTALSNSATPLPMTMILLDYCMFYPFIDMSTNDEQPMVNTNTLSRHTTGEGLRVMAVLTNPKASSGSTFRFSYTNSDGTAGRTSQTVTAGPATVFGSLVNCATATAGASQHFIGLEGLDTGVRSIESFTMMSGTDVGLIALVIVKPIATITIRETTAPVEVDYLRDTPSLPVVHDNACLNFICCPNGSLSGVTMLGDATFTWS